MNIRFYRVFFSSALCVGTALIGAGTFLSSANVANAQAKPNGAERGSFVSRLGSSLKNKNANPTQSPNPIANQRAAQPNAVPNQRSGAVPTPRPLPSQRFAAQAPARPVESQKKSCELRSSHKIGAGDLVEITLEASGEVLQTRQDGETERAPMEVVAGFKYEERYEKYSSNGPVKTIRQYEQAGMKRKFGANVARPLLDRSRQFIVAEFDGKTKTIYSPSGPMKNEQYSLLNELPCDTTILDRLLPNRTVQLGEDWRLPNEVVQALLGVDAVENNTVHLTLTSIVDDFAEVEIYLQGDADAKGNPGPSTMACASDGASVALDIEGKFQFDLKSNRLTWLGLRVDERRSESVAAPGLDWSATLQVKIGPLDAPAKLTDDVVADLRAPATPELLLLYYNGQKGFWKFRHSRRWKMIEDGETAAALCYVVGGESVAQCNILANGKIELESQPSIEGYKAEIKKGLGARFGEFVQEAAYDSPNGDSIYFVVADGTFDEVPFRWIYYLVTDKNGNQATIMFEIRADLLDKYDNSGTEIVESFQLVPRVDLAAKAAAEKAAAEAAKNGGSATGSAALNVGVPSSSEKTTPDTASAPASDEFDRAPSPEK